MEGIVDFYVSTVEPSEKEEPVLLKEEERGALSWRWHLSFLVKFHPLQVIQIESPKVPAALVLSETASVHVPLVAADNSCVSAHEFDLFVVAAFGLETLPFVIAGTFGVIDEQIERIICHFCRGYGGPSMDVQTSFIPEGLMFEAAARCAGVVRESSVEEGPLSCCNYRVVLSIESLIFLHLWVDN